MGNVTDGAYRIADHTARALGCDLLVHFAHSLIPVGVTKIKVLYVLSRSLSTRHIFSRPWNATLPAAT
jgi:2-(3-amino-3-carboxypropyl)histidine synthase